MTLAEAWHLYATLLRRLDPSRDLVHLCQELRLKGWIVEIKIRPAPKQVFEPAPLDGVICATCGTLVPGGGCKPCAECGTMSGGCA